MKKNLGVVILNWNGSADTIECVNSIICNRYGHNFDIYILDNNSEDSDFAQLITGIENLALKYNVGSYKISSFEFREEIKNGCNIYIYRSSENLGFANGNNFIINNVLGIYNYYLLLNNDTIVVNDAIVKMLDYCEKDSTIGVLSCEIYHYDQPDKLWNSGGYFTFYGDRKYYSRKKIEDFRKKNYISICTPFVTGCVMMIRESVLNEHGLFSDKFFFGEEDFNFCKRIRNITNVRTLLNSVILHKVSISINKVDFSIDQKNISDNKYILHFTNRLIDRRLQSRRMFSETAYLLYFLMIMINAAFHTRSYKRLDYILRNILKYSKMTSITQSTFNEILNLSY